jgi:hypothetical protein
MVGVTAVLAYVTILQDLGLSTLMWFVLLCRLLFAIVLLLECEEYFNSYLDLFS